MSKVEIIGFDSHADQLKRREVGVLSGSLKVYNEKLVTIDDGINNLELSMASVDTLLAGSIGHTNNTTAMGDGSNQLRSVMLGYDRVNQKARSVLVDAAGRIECSVDALEVTAETINLNTDTLEAKLAAIEILEGTIAGDTTSLDGKVTACNTGAVVLAAGSAEIGTVALSATDNAVLDAMATDLAALEVLQGTIAGDTTSLDGKVTACNTGAVVLAAGSAAIGTVALSATDNAVLDAMATDLAAIEVLQGTIAGDTTSLDGKVTACNTGAVVLAAGSAAIGTVALSATDNAVLDAMATDLAANEVLLTAIDADTNAIKTSTASCATDLAALEVLQTSTLAKIQPTRDVVTIFNNTSLASEATITSAEIDMLNFRHILMAGFSDEDEHSGNFTLHGATSSGGTYFELGSSLTGSYNSSKLFLEAKDLPVRYIKVVLTDTTPAISNIILYGFRLN